MKEFYLVLKNIFNEFLQSSLYIKIIVFITTFLAPAKEQFLLLVALLCIGWLLRLVDCYLTKCNDLWDSVTKPMLIKVFYYTMLMVTINSIQLYLFKDSFDVFKVIISIPILSETLSITQLIEKKTGINISDTLKGIIDRFSKQSKKN